MSKFIFGPVNSRRLGRSLGVDIVPKKTCNLNCVYCEVGPTTTKGMARDFYVSWEELKPEFSEVLQKKRFDVVTITGMGEPTLNKNLQSIVRGIKSLTGKPLVLLTNSLLLTEPGVRQEVLDFSIISPSLDAVLPEDFERIDRPVIPITPQDIIEGLAALRKEFSGKIWLEVLLAQNYNHTPQAIEALQDAVKRIQPDKVHLNSVGRPPLTAMKEKFADCVQPLTMEQLQAIQQKLGDCAEIIASKAQVITQKQQTGDLPDNVMQYLKRRPADQEEIAQGLNIPSQEIGAILAKLYQNNHIQKKIHEQKVVFFTDVG
ncbi:MAG: radical SAM protein [SAR324 cluster bacterium]|nr:radical SAM protein [SAR324 cluster bacterium]